MAHDPGPDLARIDRPVLAITGSRDIQVDPADVARIGRLVTGPFDGETPRPAVASSDTRLRISR